MLSFISDIIIIFSSVIPIWLLNQEDDNLKKWAPIIGLFSQPFWLFTAYTAEVWAIAFTCIPFTWVWYQSFKKHWRK